MKPTLPYLHPVERHEQPLRDCPPDPTLSWLERYGWCIVGVLIVLAFLVLAYSYGVLGE